jgi:hypothetical protein
MNTIDRIFHYTTQEKLKKVKKDGVLLPKSNPFEDENPKKMSKRVRDIVQHKHYLVGLLSPDDAGWKKYGLLEHLLKYTKGEVILEIPILKADDAFIREHALCSPKRSIEVCGDDVWKFYGGQERLNWRGIRINHMLWLDYFESTTRLTEYAGDFKAAEVWVPQETPADILNVISINK